MGLDAVELVLATEQHYAISLADDEVSKTETLKSFCQLVRQKCVEKDSRRAASYADIYTFVTVLLHSEFSIALDKIYPDSRFVKDMGLD